MRHAFVDLIAGIEHRPLAHVDTRPGGSTYPILVIWRQGMLWRAFTLPRVEILRFGLVAVNSVAFSVLFIIALRRWRSDASGRVRRLWLVVVLITGALLIGSAQRLVLQASAIGWVDSSTGLAAIETWQLVQSILVVGLAAAAFVVVGRLATSISASDRIAASILDRVEAVDLEGLELTDREHEVLMTIGRGVLTDAELSEALHISTSTVQTHVKRLLRKTGLNRRQDLIGVAYLVEVGRR